MGYSAKVPFRPVAKQTWAAQARHPYAIPSASQAVRGQASIFFDSIAAVQRPADHPLVLEADSPALSRFNRLRYFPGPSN
jgi:hypothetical protein